MIAGKADARRCSRPVRVEPPVRIELTTYALQERCSTAELRRPTGYEFIGSHIRGHAAV